MASAPNAQVLDQRVHGLVGAEHGFRAGIHVVEALLAGRSEGRREDDVARQVVARMIFVGAIHQVEDAPHFREVDAQIAQHVAVLRAFAGEQEGQLAMQPQRLFEVVDAFDFFDVARASRRPGA